MISIAKNKCNLHSGDSGGPMACKLTSPRSLRSPKKKGKFQAPDMTSMKTKISFQIYYHLLISYRKALQTIKMNKTKLGFSTVSSAGELDVQEREARECT